LEKRNKLDPTLITSDVCIKCQQCCYGLSQVAPAIPIKKSNRVFEAAEYAEVAFGDAVIYKDEEYATVFASHKCTHLDKKTGCTIYKRRPKICGDFNCFERYNSGDEKIATRYFPKLSKILNIELPTHNSSYIKVKEIL
jgi:Fe-S-cluster containining protein